MPTGLTSSGAHWVGSHWQPVLPLHEYRRAASPSSSTSAAPKPHIFCPLPIFLNTPRAPSAAASCPLPPHPGRAPSCLRCQALPQGGTAASPASASCPARTHLSICSSICCQTPLQDGPSSLTRFSCVVHLAGHHHQAAPPQLVAHSIPEAANTQCAEGPIQLKHKADLGWQLASHSSHRSSGGLERAGNMWMQRCGR